jgi:hypothetical protein
MILPITEELTVVSILDRGVPNQECIALQINQPVDLGQFGIMIGVLGADGYAVPIRDQLFWLGGARVEAGDWIFINTGDGEPRLSKTFDQQHNIYTVFWKKTNTVFANTNVVPILFKVETVDVLRPPINRPQLQKTPDSGDKLL